MRYKFDLEKIGKIVDDINRYIEDLKGFGITKEEDLFDKEVFYAASMVVFSVLNRCIDLGNEIISTCRFGMPTTYKDIFEILYRKRIIDKDVRSKCITFIYYRNLIAHEYHRIAEEQLFDIIRRIVIIDKFLKQVMGFVKK